MLPDYFAAPTVIEGVRAPDLFTLNSALGAMIEDRVVTTLNDLRPVWDPHKKYKAYCFERQAQAFPDVLLRQTTNGRDVLLGIELKGWYLLSHERMPTFRFTASPHACNAWDLVVVVPWSLSNVLSGTPIAHRPYVELAKYAAEQRNYHWQHQRDTQDNPGIKCAVGVGPYPLKKDKISDAPESDKGHNFGRLARCGIMSKYVEDMLKTHVRGIPAEAWINFIKKHAKALPPTPDDDTSESA